jgi:hypothetical protein
MGREKTHDERLFGAAVLKVSFALRGALDSPAFLAIYPGVLRDLELTDADVDAFVEQHKEAVERAARGSTGAGGSAP